MTDEKTVTPVGVNMVQKTIDVLSYLAVHTKGVKLSRIAAELCYPKTTVFDILKTLMKNDFVQYLDAGKKLYGIGAEIYTIGFAFLETSGLFKTALPYLHLLADKYEKTTFIAKRHDDRITCIYKYASPHAKAPTGNIGDRKRFHSTAIGKCYLAFDKEIASLIDTIELVPRTPYTITDREELMRNIAAIRNCGYSWEQRESHMRMACLAAPLFHHDSMAGTISMTGWYREDEDFRAQGNEIAQFAKLISAELSQD